MYVDILVMVGPNRETIHFELHERILGLVTSPSSYILEFTVRKEVHLHIPSMDEKCTWWYVPRSSCCSVISVADIYLASVMGQAVARQARSLPSWSVYV